MADGATLFLKSQQQGAGKRLLFPVAPAPGETILGYVTRAVEANHLGAVGSFLAQIDVKLHIKGDYLTRIATAFPKLADLLGTDAGSLKCLWGSEPLSEDGKRRLGGVYLRPHLICHNARRLPASGLPVESDQSTWMVKHLNFCPVTWRGLIDRCGVCRRRLTWPLAKSLNRCEGCGASSSHRAGKIVAQQDRQALSWVLDLFSADEEIVTAAFNRVPPFFRVQSATDVYELTLAFGRAVNRTRTAGRRLAPDWAPRDLADGARLVLDYPRSIWDLYKDQVKREQPSLILSLSYAAREAANACVSSNVERLIKEHRRAYGGGRGPATSHSQTMTLSEAGHLLSTVPAHVRELALTGHLLTSRANPGAVGIKVERASVLSLQKRARASVSRQQLKAAFSLPSVAIEQMLSIGWLLPEKNPSIVMLRGTETLSGASARRLISELHRFERSEPCVGDILLSDALRGVGGREKPWAPIITAAITRRLPGGLRILKIEGRAHLAIHEATARAVIMGGPAAPSPYRFERHEYGVFGRDWMTPGEVETYLNCTAQDVIWLRARKLLSKVEHETPRYDRKEVEGIGLRFMTSREASSRLGLLPKDIWQLLEARPDVKSIGQGFHERDGLEAAVREEAGKLTWWN